MCSVGMKGTGLTVSERWLVPFLNLKDGDDNNQRW